MPGAQTGDNRIPDQVVGEPISPRGPVLPRRPARAASSSDVRQSPTLRLVIAATTGTANRVPSTAAAYSEAAQSADNRPSR